MACAFILASLRHEAETYLTHGLHHEALAVYGRFLAKNRKIHPAIQTAIEDSMYRIRSAASENLKDEDLLLSDIEITHIKKGWACQASADDHVVSARAFMDLGRYESALEEYRQLLLKRRLTHTAIGGATGCLLHLVGPRHFAHAIHFLAKNVFGTSKNRVLFKVCVAEKTDGHRYPNHFSALVRHLVRLDPVPNDVEPKIRELDRMAREVGSTTVIDDAYGPIANLDELFRQLDAPSTTRNSCT